MCIPRVESFYIIFMALLGILLKPWSVYWMVFISTMFGDNSYTLVRPLEVHKLIKLKEIWRTGFPSLSLAFTSVTITLTEWWASDPAMYPMISPVRVKALPAVPRYPKPLDNQITMTGTANRVCVYYGTVTCQWCISLWEGGILKYSMEMSLIPCGLLSSYNPIHQPS